MSSRPYIPFLALVVCGAFGGVLRFAAGGLGLYGTLLVNLIGSFALGYLQAKHAHHKLPNWVYIGLGSGFLGSFTTFSAFISDTVNLSEQHVLAAVGYLIVSLVGALGLTELGRFVALKSFMAKVQDETAGSKSHAASRVDEWAASPIGTRRSR